MGVEDSTGNPKPDGTTQPPRAVPVAGTPAAGTSTTNATTSDTSATSTPASNKSDAEATTPAVPPAPGRTVNPLQGAPQSVPSQAPNGVDIPEPLDHPGEYHRQDDLGERANRIRAAVLGANDGIVSTAGIVVGVAGATTSTAAIATAGVAGLLAGALSMGAGEYVSVSSQRDTEQAAVAKEIEELRTDPEGEFEELIGLFEQRGLSRETATQVARELTERDALAAHAREELKIEPGVYVNPWSAAFSSLISFTVGASLPLAAILLSPDSIRIAATFVAVVIALFFTGLASARLAGAPVAVAIIRNVVGGALAMLVTYAVGSLLGTRL
jgi:vacuolar iron transporter family protein